MESFELYFETAKKLSMIMNGKDWYYKASFDKANRTSLSSERGPGIELGIEWMKKLKKEIPHIKIITDVHETHQVKELADIVDCIQIPAFLCRQSDILVECGKHFEKVNIKKGQWISPKQAKYFREKVQLYNKTCEVWITERGTFFGYDQLVVDFSIVDYLKQYFHKVILDCTHSTQKASDGLTGGNSELGEKYILASSIFGYDGVFAEVHPDPSKALSDKESQISIDRFENVHIQLQSMQKYL